MASLSIRGGTTIKNRILSGGTQEENNKCPFSVIAYETENPGSYKAFVEDGEVNFTSFYGVVGGAANAEFTIAPPCELAIMITFSTAKNYTYKAIDDIQIITNFNSGSIASWKTTVSEDSNGFWVTAYIPLAYIYTYTEAGSTVQTIDVKQYFCGNISFVSYFTTVNGQPAIDLFRTWPLTPGILPAPAASP